MIKITIIIDIFLSFIVGLLFVLSTFVVKFLLKTKMPAEVNKNILIIDTSHSYDSIKRHGHENMIMSRDLNRYFNKVITVYPILGSNPFDVVPTFKGLLLKRKLNEQHEFYECKMYLTPVLNHFKALNFVLSQIKLLFFLKKLIVKENVCVVRGAEPFLTGLYALILSSWSTIPYVLRIGANFDTLYKNGILTFKRIFISYKIEKLIGKIVFKNCDLVLAANDNYKQYAIQNGAPEKKVEVIRYGNIIEKNHFDSPENRPFPDNLPWKEKKFFIIVGRLTAVKHPEDVLVAFEKIYRNNKDIGIVFVGEGDTENELKTLCKKLCIENNVVFTGNKDQQWLHKVYPNALAYLSPLTGRALVEAALAELPMIAYDYEWHSEVVKNGETGYLVEYRNVDQMADAMMDVILNTENAKKLGSNARKFVIEIMHYDKLREKEIAAYNKMFKVKKYV